MKPILLTILILMITLGCGHLLYQLGRYIRLRVLFRKDAEESIAKAYSYDKQEYSPVHLNNVITSDLLKFKQTLKREPYGKKRHLLILALTKGMASSDTYKIAVVNLMSSHTEISIPACVDVITMVTRKYYK